MTFTLHLKLYFISKNFKFQKTDLKWRAVEICYLHRNAQSTHLYWFQHLGLQNQTSPATLEKHDCSFNILSIASFLPFFPQMFIWSCFKEYLFGPLFIVSDLRMLPNSE